MTYHIKEFMNTLIPQQENWKLFLLKEWHTIIGNLSSKVILDSITEESIVLGVYDSCWMQELYMLSPLLLQMINASLDKPRIKQIRFKKATRTKHMRQQEQKSKVIRTSPEIPLTTTQKNALAHIKDPILQDALKALLMRCYQEK